MAEAIRRYTFASAKMKQRQAENQFLSHPHSYMQHWLLHGSYRDIKFSLQRALDHRDAQRHPYLLWFPPCFLASEQRKVIYLLPIMCQTRIANIVPVCGRLTVPSRSICCLIPDGNI